MKERRNLLPLNIQLFAEGDSKSVETNSSTEVEETPKIKTYSENEYNALKSALDKANAEAKKSKDALRARLSDDEKAKEAEDLRAKEHEQIKQELRELKLSNALISGGFTQEETEKLVELRVNDDDTAFAKYLTDLRKNIVETTTQTTRKTFSQENHIPGGTSGDETATSRAVQKAKAFKNETTKAKWGQFEI